MLLSIIIMFFTRI